MENNSMTPSSAPAPAPGTNMPEFAAAPAAPAPVIPPATSMPTFGAPQPAQPVMPMPPEPAAPEAPAPAPEAQPEQPAPAPEEAPASTLGEIKNEQVQASELATQEQAQASATPFVEAQSTVPTPGNPAAPVPAPEKKKTNVKLLAIAGGALVLVGGIVAAVLLMNQPKPTSNPIDNPAPVVATVDTSVDFDKLTAEQATTFLESTDSYETYFPEDYADETAMSTLSSVSGLGIFYSYEKADDILDIAKKSTFAEKFKDKIAEETTTIDQKEKYAFVTFDESTGCGKNCNAVIFDKKVLNFYSEPYTDVLTGVTSEIVHIMLISHKEADVKAYAPIVAAVFMTGEKVYSTSITSSNGEYEYVVNSVKYADSSKKTVKAVKTHFKVIATGEFLYLPDKTEEKELKASATTEDGEDKEPSTDEDKTDTKEGTSSSKKKTTKK